MNGRPSGLLVPITTPFDAQTGDVAPVALRENARVLLGMGVDGLVATGSTGEAALLADDEYCSVVRWLREVVPDDRWLVVGAGRESTRATIDACRVAGDQGADAVLLRAPSYYSVTLSTTALAAHFRRIADDSPVPVLLYNMPKYTHVNFSEALVAALVDHANIVGLKESSGDLKQFAVLQATAPQWALFMGSGSRFYSGLELGAAGGVLAVACFAAGIAVRVRDKFRSGDRAAAGAAQEILSPLSREIVDGLGVPGVKAAMDAAGLVGGPVRPPLMDLAEADRARIASLVTQALGAAGNGARAPARRN
ncbi:MAG: dihydrodipicolinate synthase family protein [Gemmatimonadetes bacterium]|nr:dihydrodipicolinate synthase family protein [Gemmatimonadota bacterium]